MAIYNETSSGNLIFAITGLGNPVSTFASEGIATSTIAGSPIAGDNPQIWTIGPPNFFSSSGGLSIVEYNLGTQSGLAASAIGEFPLSGIVDNIPQINVTKTNASQELVSTGNLVITGNTVANRAWFRLSDGNLELTGNTVNDIDLRALSTGNLVIDGATASSTLLNQLSAGNLIVNTSDSFIISLEPKSAGNLVVTGETIEIQAWNKQSAGNLVTTGNTVNGITIQTTSSGTLVVTDFGYGNSLFTGGIAADPLASQAIASGNLANVVTTQVSFYGDIESSGNLVIEPVGELVNGLSDSSGLAGAAQAAIPIGGGMDTLFTASRYQDIWNQDSAGELTILGASGYGYTYTTAGNLVITGTTVVAFSRNRDSAGELIITGTDSSNQLQNIVSAGELVQESLTQRTLSLADSSGIAGAAIATLPVAGGVDTVEVNVHEILLNEDSAGNLEITGETGQSSTRNFDSNTGNVIITATDSYNSRRNALTAGQLTILATDAFETVWATTSQGTLLLFDASTANVIQIEESSGNAVVTGSTQFDVAKARSSAGDLEIIGNTVSRTVQTETSSGQLLSVSPGQVTESLSDSSGIAGAAVATITIGGGMDSYPISTEFVDIWNPESQGQLVVTGSSVTVRTLNFLSQGQLAVLGASAFSDRYNRSTAGNVVITGNSVANIQLVVNSAGNISVTPVGNAVTSAPSAIAGSAVAEAAIGGSWTTYTAVEQVSYISNGQFFPGNVVYTTTAGTVLMSGNTVVQFRPNGDVDSSGNLVINGTTVASSTQNSASAGLLTITGTTVESADYARTSLGNLAIVAASAQNVSFNVDSSGNVVITGTSSDEFIPAGFVTSSGNLVINGTTAHNSTVSTVSLGLEIITGTSQSVFVPAVKPTPVGGGGGSYVFPSSWDILKPYFPDDRHILGYQQAQTDPGNLRVTGFTQVTVISNPGARRKTLGDYIKSLEQSPRPNLVQSAPTADTVPAAVQDFVQLALVEDQLLLSDKLWEFDPIQAELDQELNQ